jgi:hypothetical protein
MTIMAKPRRVSAMSTVLKETQEYQKISQEEEQVTTAMTEKQLAVETEKQIVVHTEGQQSVSTGLQQPINTEPQQSAFTAIQKAANTEPSKRGHKQTIVIDEDLAFRLKVHAARRKETIASIAIRAFEKLLAEEEEI